MASPLQFSVRQLLIVVAFLALALTALRNANSYWMSGLWGGVLLMLGISILPVIFRRGAIQAFWSGFALFGCLYAAVVLIAYWPRATASGYFPLSAHQLATTQLADWAYMKMIPAAQRESQIPNPAVPERIGIVGSWLMPNPDYVDRGTFQQIGHTLWLVILAALGGKLAQWIHRTGVREHGSGVSGS